MSSERSLEQYLSSVEDGLDGRAVGGRRMHDIVGGDRDFRERDVARAVLGPVRQDRGLAVPAQDEHIGRHGHRVAAGVGVGPRQPGDIDDQIALGVEAVFDETSLSAGVA